MKQAAILFFTLAASVASAQEIVIKAGTLTPERSISVAYVCRKRCGTMRAGMLAALQASYK